MIKAIKRLHEKDFLVKQPIISNSNYVLYLLKKLNLKFHLRFTKIVM